MKAFLSTAVCCLALHCVAHAETLLDDFDSLAFDISDTTGLQSGTFSEVRATPLGNATFTAHVTGCRMSAASGKLTISQPAPGAGYAGFSYELANPVNLSAFDYISFVTSHNRTNNPLDGIYLYLADGRWLELRNLGQSPFLPNQRKFPLYDFSTYAESWINHPEKVVSIFFQFVVFGGNDVLVEKAAFEIVGPRKGLAATIRLGKPYDLVVEANRVVNGDELIRLESSSDLSRWSPHSALLQGDGKVPTFPKYFDQQPFFRFSWFNIVPRE